MRSGPWLHFTLSIDWKGWRSSYEREQITNEANDLAWRPSHSEGIAMGAWARGHRPVRARLVCINKMREGLSAPCPTRLCIINETTSQPGCDVHTRTVIEIDGKDRFDLVTDLDLYGA